jgi:hypothetical protein
MTTTWTITAIFAAIARKTNVIERRKMPASDEREPGYWLTNRAHYAITLDAAEAEATSLLDNAGRLRTASDEEVDQAHVVLDAIACLRGRISHGYEPWSEYS